MEKKSPKLVAQSYCKHIKRLFEEESMRGDFSYAALAEIRASDTRKLKAVKL